LQWQPVFFSGIALVLGLQGLIAGMVLANRSPVVTATVRRHYRFVDNPRFGYWCLVGGAATLFAGLVIDASLFYTLYVVDDKGLTRGPALASLAQSLIIAGASLTVFGIVYGLLSRGAGVGVHVTADETGEIEAAPDPPSTPPKTREAAVGRAE
jgi:hypothetical protein